MTSRTTWAGTAIAGVLALTPALPGQLTTVEELVAARAEKRAKPVFQKANWLLDYDEAREEAKKQGKLLFTYFSRSYAY